MTAQLRAGLREAAVLGASVVGVWLVLPPQRATPLRVATLAVFLSVTLHAAGRVAAASRARPVVTEVPRDLAPPGEHRIRVARLDTSMTYASASARQFDRTVRPLLASLVEERLVRRRGVDLRAAPATARAIIGEELWQLVQTGPPAPDGVPGPSAADLARLVALAEAV